MDPEEAVKKELKALGIPEAYVKSVMATYNVKTEEEAKTAVASFKQNIFDVFKNESDSKEKEAKVDAVKEYERLHGLNNGKRVDPDPTKPIPPKPAGDTTPSPQAGDTSDLTQRLQQLEAQIQEVRDQKQAEARLATAKEALAKKGVPESWLSLINTANEDIDGQVESLSQKYGELKQSAIDESVKNGGMGTPVDSGTERSVQQWADLMDGKEV